MKKWWLDKSHAFVEVLAEREKKKRYSLAIEKMRDRAIEGCVSKVEEKGDENGNGLCWLERKIVSWENLPHFLVVKDA